MKKLPRRKFIYLSSLLPISLANEKNVDFLIPQKSTDEIISVATWKFGKHAVEKAIEVMKSGGSSLDAVEQGANVIEADPDNHSVGIGGYPDEEGKITLDAAIMDWKGNAGSVAFLKNILHPISVARKVMEKTKHVLLVGEGALKFALENGFTETNLMTDDAYEKWKKRKNRKSPYRVEESHDTIGVIAIDKSGNISAGTSTSGSENKVHGRVGDTPIIGAGLYVDNEVGGAVATGMGELSMKSLGCFLIVEKMKDGYSPQEACELAVKQSEKFNPGSKYTICFLALNKAGEAGAFATHKAFQYAVATKNKSEIITSKYLK